MDQRRVVSQQPQQRLVHLPNGAGGPPLRMEEQVPPELMERFRRDDAVQSTHGAWDPRAGGLQQQQQFVPVMAYQNHAHAVHPTQQPPQGVNIQYCPAPYHTTQPQQPQQPQPPQPQQQFHTQYMPSMYHQAQPFQQQQQQLQQQPVTYAVQPPLHKGGLNSSAQHVMAGPYVPSNSLPVQHQHQQPSPQQQQQQHDGSVQPPAYILSMLDQPPQQAGGLSAVLYHRVRGRKGWVDVEAQDQIRVTKDRGKVFKLTVDAPVTFSRSNLYLHLISLGEPPLPGGPDPSSYPPARPPSATAKAVDSGLTVVTVSSATPIASQQHQQYRCEVSLKINILSERLQLYACVESPHQSGGDSIGPLLLWGKTVEFMTHNNGKLTKKVTSPQGLSTTSSSPASQSDSPPPVRSNPVDSPILKQQPHHQPLPTVIPQQQQQQQQKQQ
eukprot:TRINITY_DN554_c2_g1_i2.p1 TRINITY_DN554_c2_g1~~TRINITY_DN554_c2_g1_i2.p1  ORF type:complete len:439 (-),score=133.99 TRINITY_DN554_c2_g1_i2:75-1391(-)